MSSHRPSTDARQPSAGGAAASNLVGDSSNADSTESPKLAPGDAEERAQCGQRGAYH
jgi:hypothetical protein